MPTLPDDMSQNDADAIQAERARMFTTRFWLNLLRGQEGLGDTFWAGNYLSGLFLIPVVVLLLAIPPASGLLPFIFIAFGIYLLAVARAVAIAKPKGDTGLGWKIAGVAWTLLNAASCLAYAPFVGP
ncbi:hypothetical protein [Celeribacter arenosi]|uniref:DUF805 domain-containing protein n=1 Tax=Celeribacter arenosi TaxID=792649 RepID=A0ABP7KBP0_9RHOB